jgi:uncharacterized membrane protein YhaH (DUF805 family)
MTKSIFLSYRRDDSAGAAGRLFDLLSQKLDGVKVFMDVDSLEPGVDFASVIDERLSGCDYFIAVIGPDWAGIKGPDESRRLEDANDYVRLEIEAALRRNIRVVPVLVDNARMPRPDEVPASLHGLLRRNAIELPHHSFSKAAAELAGSIRRNLGLESAESPATEASAAGTSWADELLSFRGRMSRKRFWLWWFVLLICSLAMQHLILLSVGSSLGESFSQEMKQIPLQHQLLVDISTLPFLLATLAITAKRLHDFSAGWGFVLALIVLLVLFYLSEYGAILAAQDPQVAAENRIAMEGFVFAFAVLILVMWIAIGAVPGTPGANRFGPVPR